ncbi:MAG TPA: Spy/CpxP family protein refolding chaperone [Devosia sp.]|nr:Spy/CpxP family protein refolding chaperone [Devosia sp.]
MKTITTTALAVLMTAGLCLAATAPAAAQDAAPAQAQAQDGFDHRNHGPRQMGRMGGGDLLRFARGAEGIEVALVRLSHRIELTPEQQPLFDAFKAVALSAAADFASATEGLRPAVQDEGETAAMPGFSERLANRIAIDTARLAALEAVQPAATAFFDSLTAEQQAQLNPQRPHEFGDGGPRHQGQQHERPAAPADAPAANG